MKTTIWFILTSCNLDIRFLKLREWTVYRKLAFLFYKYYLIIKHFFIPFKLGISNVNFLGRKIYYDTKFGLAGYQGILVRHRNLITIANVKKPKTIIDVGANVGFFTFLVREMFPRANIYSVEPIPQVYEVLVKNFSQDKYVKACNWAIADKSGFVNMTFDQNNSAISSISKSGKIRIKSVNLDKFIKQFLIKSIDMLKIDTEGYESFALKGAQKTLSITKYLYVEATIKDNDNYTFTQLMSQLYSSNFNFQLIAFRSFEDVGEGEATIFDLMLKNVNLVK